MEFPLNLNYKKNLTLINLIRTDWNFLKFCTSISDLIKTSHSWAGLMQKYHFLKWRNRKNYSKFYSFLTSTKFRLFTTCLKIFIQKNFHFNGIFINSSDKMLMFVARSIFQLPCATMMLPRATKQPCERQKWTERLISKRHHTKISFLTIGKSSDPHLFPLKMLTAFMINPLSRKRYFPLFENSSSFKIFNLIESKPFQ